MQNANLLVDAALVQSIALPNGAASVTSAAIDLMNSANGDFKADVELLVSAPLLVVGDLANGDTMTYDIVHSVNANLSSPATLFDNVITQTGAGGAGAAAATATVRLPANVRRYVGVKATNDGAGDASDKSATLTPRF